MSKYSKGKTYDEVRRDLQNIRDVLNNNPDLARKYEDRVEKYERDCHVPVVFRSRRVLDWLACTAVLEMMYTFTDRHACRCGCHSTRPADVAVKPV